MSTININELLEKCNKNLSVIQNQNRVINELSEFMKIRGFATLEELQTDKHLTKMLVCKSIFLGEDATEAIKTLDTFYSSSLRCGIRIPIPSIKMKIDNSEYNFYYISDQNKVHYFVALNEVFQVTYDSYSTNTIDSNIKTKILPRNQYIKNAISTVEQDYFKNIETIYHTKSFGNGISKFVVDNKGENKFEILVTARGIFNILNTMIKQETFSKVFKIKNKQKYCDYVLGKILLIATKLSYTF